MSEEPESVDRSVDDLFYTCLGEFVHTFSLVEISLVDMLRRVCAMPWRSAHAVFANMRAKDAIQTIRRVLNDSPRLLTIEPYLAKVAEINDARNLLLHRGIHERDGDGYVVTNRWVRRPDDDVRNTKITTAILEAMTADLRRAELLLMWECAQDSIRKHPRLDLWIDRHAKAIASTWQYKSQLLALEPEAPRKTPPKPQPPREP